jgi:polyisoprenoid-binding protein YceI
MKTTIKLLAFLFVTAAIAVSCGSGSEDAQAEVGQAQEVAAETGTAYAVNSAESIVNWKGEKFNGDFHTGTIKVKDGSLSVEDGNITAGSFTIDMTSIAVTDETPEDKKPYLVAHLAGTTGEAKDADFFNTNKYPTATFEITKVEALEGVAGKTHKISGNLTMLETTKEVTFDANVAMTDGKLTASTDNFTFDRTLWGIKFMSTISGFVKEKALKDDIAISINLVAAE